MFHVKHHDKEESTMMNDQREQLRTNLIREQRQKTEAGLEMILDGSDLAEVHIRIALEIVADAWQGTALARSLARVTEARLAMWGALGSLNNYAAFSEEES
jgi:hypothetical protein